MPDEENPTQEPVTGGENPTQEPVTGGENPTQEPVTGGENPTQEPTTEESQEETFPSFRKAYKYRGGFDKFVYDQLKKANGEE